MRHTLALMLVVLCLGSCGIAAPSTAAEATPPRSTLIPPITFQEADLIGRWEKIFTKYSTEVLILNPDYTFLQMYETAQGDYESRGTWRVEQRASGCVYIHLEGMRFFYGSEAFEVHGNRFTPGGEPYRFWERCEDQMITMPDKVVLIVTDRPNLARGIGLLFPSTASDPGSSSSESMLLTADAAGLPLARPTPPRP